MSMKALSILIQKIPFQARASAVILISSFITSAFGFLTTPVFTRLMSVEEFGLVTQYNSVLEVVTVVATLSLSAGVYQVAMNEFSSDRDTFTFSSMILSNLATIVVFAIIFVLRERVINIIKLTPDLIFCMFLYLLIYPAMQMWMAKQRYEYKYKTVAAVSIFSVAFNLGTAVVCVIVAKNVNLGAVKIWSMSLTQIVTALVVYYFLGKNARWKIDWRYIKYAFAFNAPLLIHYLAQYVLRSSDKMMITYFCGERATGLYGLGSTVASIALMAWSAMAASLTPYMYSHINTKEYDKVNRAVIAVVGIFGVCCIGVALVGPEIVYILGSQKYMENIQLIPPIAASSLLAAIYGIYSTIVFYHHKRTSTAIMTIIAAGINIILNYILIPKYGYIAAAYTTEIAYLIYTFLHYANYRRIVGEERVFNDKIIWAITGITTISCLCVGMFYDKWIIRYGLVLMAFIVIVCLRTRILAIVKVLIGGRETNE